MIYDLPQIGEWVATKDKKPEEGTQVLGLWIDATDPVNTIEHFAVCFRELDDDVDEYSWFSADSMESCTRSEPPQFWAQMNWGAVSYDDGKDPEAL